MTSTFTLPALGFILTVAFGFWLSSLGKPYNGLLFNAHKLLALGVVILLVIRLVQLDLPSGSLGWVAVLLGLALLSVVALFASGALMSAGKLEYRLALLVHRIAPLALVLALALAIYLVARAP